jgi:hypothetical protein
MRKMQAKFRGRCKGCGETIAVGSDILWSKQTGAFHDNDRCYADTGLSRTGGDGGSIADYEVDVDAQLARRDEAEYRQGYHDVAQIHAISEAGSDFREQLYRELEERDYNLYG